MFCCCYCCCYVGCCRCYLMELFNTDFTCYCVVFTSTIWNSLNLNILFRENGSNFNLRSKRYSYVVCFYSLCNLCKWQGPMMMIISSTVAGQPPTTFLCVCVNNNSISLDNSRFTRQYGNSCFNTMAEFLQFIPLLRLASTNIVNNIRLEIAALLLACR